MFRWKRREVTAAAALAMALWIGLGFAAPPAFCLPSTSRAESPPTLEVEGVGWVASPSAWLAKPASHVSELVQLLLTTRFTTPWNANGSDGTCADFRSDGYPAWGASYWLHMCHRNEVSGEWQKYFYEIEGDTTARMERVDWVGRARNSPPDWTPLIDALVDSLQQRGAKLVSRSKYELTSLSKLTWSESDISVELYFEPSDPSVRRLTVSRFSPHLIAALKNRDLNASTDDRNDSIPGPSPGELIPLLRTQWPQLATAFERGPKVSTTDLSAVVRTLQEARREPDASNRRDLALFAANLWCESFAEQRQQQDTLAVRLFNQALSPFGAHIEGNQDWWSYDNGLSKSLPDHAGGTSRWADFEFLRSMWSGAFGDPNEWDNNRGLLTTIDKGEAFLRDHPGSAITADVKRMLAQAHETAWCVAQSTLPDDPSWPVKEIRAQGPDHRQEARRLYGEYLRERPDDRRDAAIHKRLRRMSLGIDTSYYKYWFSGD